MSCMGRMASRPDRIPPPFSKTETDANASHLRDPETWNISFMPVRSWLFRANGQTTLDDLEGASYQISLFSQRIICGF